MQFKGLVPVINCQHIEQTLEFYQQALRYIIINKTETENGLQWAYLKCDETFIMLQKSEALETDHINSGNISLHYYTSDIAAQHQFMSARGIKVGPIEDTAYSMKQFLMIDPEGNRISIGQNTKP